MTKIYQILLTLMIFGFSGCATTAKKTEVANQQFEQVIASIKKQSPEILIKAQISKFVNPCNEGGLFGGAITKDGVPTKGELAIPLGESFQCVYVDLGALDYMNAILSCGESQTGFEAINCLQNNNKHIGKISSDRRSNIYNEIKPFTNENEFNSCIKKFSNEISGQNYSRTNNGGKFTDCIAKVRHGKTAKEIRFSGENLSVNSEAPIVRSYVCDSSEKPRIIRDQAEDPKALVIRQLYLIKNSDLMALRKVLQCD